MTTPPSLDGWASCFDFDFLDEDDEHELQNMGADRPTRREQEQLSCSNMYNNKPQEESEQIYVRGLGQVDYVPALEGEKALRLVTFNVARAFNKKRAEIKAFMEKHMVDIMLLQETGWYSPPRADSLSSLLQQTNWRTNGAQWYGQRQDSRARSTQSGVQATEDQWPSKWKPRRSERWWYRYMLQPTPGVAQRKHASFGQTHMTALRTSQTITQTCPSSLVETLTLWKK